MKPAFRPNMMVTDWTEVGPVRFLVDWHKHRIVVREGVWRMYCPERGPDSLIYARSWGYVLRACQTSCPHDELLHRR